MEKRKIRKVSPENYAYPALQQLFEPGSRKRAIVESLIAEEENPDGEDIPWH